MKTLRKFFFLPIAVLFLLLLIQPTVFAASASTYLYIQQAKEGVLIDMDDKKDVYRLVLTGVNPIVVYFQNSASSKSGLMTLANFYKDWSGGTLKGVSKADTAAGLVGSLHQLKNGEDSSIAVQLSSPQFDSFNNTVTYTANLPRSKEIMSTTTQFKNLVLFIGPLKG